MCSFFFDNLLKFLQLVDLELLAAVQFWLHHTDLFLPFFDLTLFARRFLQFFPESFSDFFRQRFNVLECDGSGLFLNFLEDFGGSAPDVLFRVVCGR